jgi:DNA sulfur modification protein DndE
MINKLMKVLLLPMFILIFLFSCQSPAKQGMVAGAGVSAGISNDSIVSLVQQAYLFGYPLVLMDATKKVTTNVPVPLPNKSIAPVNQFGHFRTFPDANFTEVVKPNCDTYYSSAWLDLSAEPLVLSVPNTNGRFYLMPMLDAYTNIFASPGKRTTGTEAGNFLITGPGFSGTIPAGMTEIKAPTNLVWIIGRTQTNSPQDGATVVRAIQDGYRLTPLSKWGSSFTPPINKVDTTAAKMAPPQAVEQMDIETFINRMNALMSANPPAAADSAFLAKLSAIGVGAGKTFSLSAFDAPTQEKLKAIPAAVPQQLKAAAAKMGQLENGWNVTRSGLGTYGTNYKLRALIALVGLGANLNIDASYPNCLIDNNGEKLNGSRKYVIHFNKGETPPVNAFWSVTMYGPNDLLVANPINRFAIGDRDKLKYNKDGSLDIYIQRENPGKDKESNWLPADKDAFSLTMRLYWPKEQFLDGSWKVPPVTQVK